MREGCGGLSSPRAVWVCSPLPSTAGGRAVLCGTGEAAEVEEMGQAVLVPPSRAGVGDNCPDAESQGQDIAWLPEQAGAAVLPYICKGPAPCPSERPGTLSQDKQILLRAVMLAGAALCRP